MNWLVKFAEEAKSEEQSLQESVDSLPREGVLEMAYSFDPSLRPTQVGSMRDKLAEALRRGQELAQEHGDSLEKQALISQMVSAGAKAVGSQGIGGLAKGLAKDVAVNTIANGVTGGLKKAVQPAANTSAFKYAMMGNVGAAGGLIHKAVGSMARNPGMLLPAAGAVGGALMAPRDEQGNKHYLQGAAMGGALGLGAHLASGGAIGNSIQKGVMQKKSPLLGQNAAGYVRGAAKADAVAARAAMPAKFGPAAPSPDYSHITAPAKPGMSGAAPNMSPAPHAAGPMGGQVAPRPPVSNTGNYNGGPVGGQAAVTTVPVRMGGAAGTPLSTDPSKAYFGAVQPHSYKPTNAVDQQRYANAAAGAKPQAAPVGPAQNSNKAVPVPGDGTVNLGMGAVKQASSAWMIIQAGLQKKANAKALVYNPATRVFDRPGEQQQPKQQSALPPMR